MKVLAELLSHLLPDGLKWFCFSEKVIKLSLVFNAYGFIFSVLTPKALVMWSCPVTLSPDTECWVFKVWGIPLLNLKPGCQHCWELREARLSLWKGTRLFTRMTAELTQWLYGTFTFGMFWKAPDTSLSDKLPASQGVWSFSTLLGFFQSSQCNSGSILMCHYLDNGNYCVLFEEKKIISETLVIRYL